MKVIPTVVAVGIVLVWAAVIVQGMIVGEFKGPITEITPVVLIAAGYLLARETIAGLRNGQQNQQQQPLDPGGEQGGE